MVVHRAPDVFILYVGLPADARRAGEQGRVLRMQHVGAGRAAWLQ